MLTVHMNDMQNVKLMPFLSEFNQTKQFEIVDELYPYLCVYCQRELFESLLCLHVYVNLTLYAQIRRLSFTWNALCTFLKMSGVACLQVTCCYFSCFNNYQDYFVLHWPCVLKYSLIVVNHMSKGSGDSPGPGISTSLNTYLLTLLT